MAFFKSALPIYSVDSHSYRRNTPETEIKEKDVNVPELFKKSLKVHTLDPALVHAARTGNVRALQKAMCQDGIDIHAICADKGYTLLHHAICGNQVFVIKTLLILGANPTRANMQGLLPVHLATAKDKNPNILTELHRHGHNLGGIDREGNTALHCAAKSGNIAAIQRLLELGAPLCEKNNAGETPLQIAVEEGNLAAVQAIVENGNAVLLTDDLEQSLRWAHHKNHPEIIWYFLDQGVNPRVFSGKSYSLAGYDVMLGKMDTVRHIDEADEVYLSAKMLAHVLDVVEEDIPFEGMSEGLEGTFGNYTALPYLYSFDRAMTDNLSRFDLTEKEAVTLKKAITEGYALGSAEELSARVRKREITIVQTGWRDHAVSLCFYDGYMAINNTGQGSRANGGLRVYKIDPLKVSPEEMSIILNYCERDVVVGTEYLYNELPALFAPTPGSNEDLSTRINSGEFVAFGDIENEEAVSFTFFYDYVAITNPGQVSDSEKSLEIFRIDPKKVTPERISLLKQWLSTCIASENPLQMCNILLKMFMSKTYKEKNKTCKTLEGHAVRFPAHSDFFQLLHRKHYYSPSTSSLQDPLCQKMEQYQPIPQEHGFCNFESKRASIGTAWTLMKLRANPEADVTEVLQNVNDFHNYTVETTYKFFRSGLDGEASPISDELKARFDTERERRRDIPKNYFVGLEESKLIALKKSLP